MMDFTSRDNGRFDDDSVNLQDGANPPGRSVSAGRVLLPDANGVVVLPGDATLEDVRAEGRDLVVELSDGTRYVIPDGAIVVPQLVVGGVAIPPLNLAALLVDSEPEPAAGNPRSSGGNFAVDPGDIQAAYGLGDLLPYTEFARPEEPEREVIPGLLDREPDVVIETPDNPAGVVNAIATVDEEGLPARKGEPAGTGSETSAETTSGTIVFATPDGLASIALNGVVISEVGQTFVTDLGVLTITSIDLARGEIGFSYTLTDNSFGSDGVDPFAVTVIDRDGDTASATLNVQIVDDQPIVVADVDAIAAGNYGPATGNVITGEGTAGTTADEVGADGATLTGIANSEGVAGSATQEGALVVQGLYGTLTIAPDGSYSYVRAPGTAGGVRDVFTYTLTDGDGSTASTTLTIDIGDSPAVVISVPEAGAGTIVDEGGLPPRTDGPVGSGEGSDGIPDNDSDGSEATSGTITFAAPDGVATVEINGVVVTGPGQVITVPEGTLTIIGFDPDSGTLDYTFTLGDDTSGDDTSVTFTVTVTDVDGDSDSADFTVHVIDDEPVAVDDFATQGAENASIIVDAFANDITGADGVALSDIAVVGGTLSGAGTLTYNGDGTFTYVPAPGEDGDANGHVTFDYTITDADGDVSTATVTITLLGDSTPSIQLAGDNSVDEAGLPARGSEPEGSDAAANSETAVGTITPATGNDTLASLVINGVNVTAGGTVTTATGILTVTANADGTYGYSYTLSDNTLNDPDSDSFTLTVTDSDGDTATTTLVIGIVDDAPAASDDANTLGAGEYGPVVGNVTANDAPGADDFDVVSFSGTGGNVAAGMTVRGTYGTLTIEPDGSYSYTRDPGTPGGVADSFDYVIRDGDGDTASATLVITIADSPVTVIVPQPDPGGDPALSDAGTVVYEAGLAGPPAGSAAAGDGEQTSGSITYTAPDGPAVVTIGGDVVNAVGQTIDGAFGTLTITSIANGVIGYTYELTTNTSGDTTSDVFPVTVTDQDNDTTSSSLEVMIVDDVPTARADTDSVTEDSPLVADGNVITGSGGADANTADGVVDTTGADGASVTAVSFGAVTGTVGGSTAGAYGSLVLKADGSYEYQLDNANGAVQGLDSSETLTETFTYTITDGDGDPATTTLTITISGANDPVTIGRLDLAAPEVTLDEDDLPVGSDTSPEPLSQSGTFTVTSPDGLNTLTVGGQTVFEAGQSVTFPVTVDDPVYGLLTITGIATTTDAAGDVVSATISYTYVLDGNSLRHDQAGQDSFTDSFDVVATDTDGSVDTASLDIRIVDDVPGAKNDGPVSQGTENTAFTIDALINDVFGADGVTTTNGTKVFVSSQAAQGTVTYDPATGMFTYTPAPNAGSGGNLSDSFEYTIIDGDGDASTATVTVTLQPDSEPQGGQVTATLDDDGLANGNPASPADLSDLDANAGDDPADVSEASFTGTVSFDLGNDGPGTVAFDPALNGATATIGRETVTYSVSGNKLTATGPRGELFTVTITNPVTGDYVVTLLDNVFHAGGPNQEATDALATLGFVVTDSEGDAGTASLSIVFDDDAPTAYDNANSVTEGGAAAGNVLSDANLSGKVDLPGADGFAGTGAIGTVASINAPASVPTTDSTGHLVITGQYGTLTVDPATGAYTYESNANSTNADVQDVFSYTVVDGDGDTSTSTLTIDIDNVAGQVFDNDAIVNEAGLDGIGSASGADSEFDTDGQITVVGAAPGTVLTYQIVGSSTGQYGTITLDPLTGAYTYDLTSPVDGDDPLVAQGGDNGANTVTGEESFSYRVVDNNGNEIGTGTIQVSIVDDVPVASDQATVTVAEDAPGTIGGNVMTDGTPDTQGADGATVTSFTVNGVTTSVPQDGSPGSYANGNGSYLVDMFGNWTFDPAPGLDQTSGDIAAGFTYTLTDGDGDTDTAAQPITITDGAGPVAGPSVAVLVDDQNLVDASGNPFGPDIDSDTIAFTAGSDAIATIRFGSTAGLDPSLDWVVSPDGQTIVGSDGADPIVTLTLVRVGDTVTVTATLSDNYDSHPVIGTGLAGDDTFALGSVDVVARDIDGDEATSSVSVAVSDDVPDAIDDAPQSVAEDAAGSVGANLLANDDGGADVDATVTSFTVGAVTTAVPQDGSAAVLATTNGTYTVYADGAWTFDPNPGLDQSAGNIDAGFTYTLTDADGDYDSASQPITITDGVGPVAGPGVSLLVDDGNLVDANDNPIGPDSDSGTVVFTAGSDAIATIGFGAVTGLHPSLDWNVSADGQTITGYDGADLIVTVTLVRSGDSVTVTAELSDNYDSHPLAGDDTFDLGDVEIIARDIDGDEASATVSVAVSDDEPLVTVTGVEDSATVDETNLNVTDFADFAGSFSVSYGADGELSTAYTLGVTSALSGLTDTATGQPVGIALEGTAVVGRNTAGDEVFRVTVDGNGRVTLDQNRAVIHSDPTLANEPVTLADGLITLKLTATDNDNDVADATIAIGANLVFLDDAPVTLSANPTGVQAIVDETSGFPTSYTTTSSVVSGVIDAGNDGLKSLAFALDLTGDGSTSLTTSQGGYAITLVHDEATTPNLVTGTYVDGSGVTQTAFTVVIDATGKLTVTLNTALNHPVDGPEGPAHDDPLDLAGLVNAVVTITDGDDDPLSAEAPIGNLIIFKDDGPSAQDDTNTLTEDTASVAGNLLTDGTADSYGNDGAGSIQSISGSGGAGSVGGTTPGAFGTLTLQPGGGYTYALNTAAVQYLDTGENVVEVFNYTIVDADGDTSSATLTITITGTNDAPTITPDTGAVSDEGLAYGNADALGNPTDTTDALSDGGTLTIADPDDSAADFAVTLGTPTLALTSNGDAVTWSGAGTGLLIGSAGGSEVIRISITDAGAWSIQLSAPIDHVDASGENVSSLVVPVTVSDGEATGGSTIAISLEDDSPVGFTPVHIDDTTNATATAQDNPLLNNGSANVTRLINDANNDGIGENFIGGDGFGSLTFINGTNGQALATTGGSAVTSGGDAVYLFGFGTGTLTATTSATNTDPGGVVFTVTLDEGTTGGSDATYQIEFFAELDDGSGTVFDDFSAIKPNQYDWVGFQADGTLFDNTINGSEDILITSKNSTTGVAGTVNMSSTDIGANNQWMEVNETLRLDFVIDGAGAGSEKTPRGYSFEQHYDVTNASFSVIQLKGGSLASVTLRLLDDPDTGNKKDLTGTTVSVEPGSVVVTNSAGADVSGSRTITYNADGTVTVGGLQSGDSVSFEGVSAFNALEMIHAGAGDFSMGAFGFTSPVLGSNLPFEFDVQAKDFDGDTSTGTIGFTVTPDTLTPVVLDISGKGLAFAGIDQGIAYDYDGDGVKTQTAWVMAGSAILVHDADNNNTVTGASEFVFGGNGMTDLQAIAASYDENGDGRLDAQDSAFGQFGIWQDHDQDAEADAGEYTTLTDAGITSISLVSDGTAGSAAGGDVTIFGEASFTWEDGSTGVFADAGFQLGADVDGAAMDLLLAAHTAELPDDPVAMAERSTADLADARVAIADIDDNGAVDAILDGLLGDVPLGGHGVGGDAGGGYVGAFDFAAVSLTGTDSFSQIIIAEMHEDATALAAAQSA
ncbi:DUF5801 repeats-in-toxin domain-containing protein [Altererythrobacter sp. CAU 1778]